jgi:hypothetical protein
VLAACGIQEAHSLEEAFTKVGARSAIERGARVALDRQEHEFVDLGLELELEECRG